MIIKVYKSLKYNICQNPFNMGLQLVDLFGHRRADILGFAHSTSSNFEHINFEFTYRFLSTIINFSKK